MQADVDSNPRRPRRPHEGAAAHAAMLEMNNRLLRPVVESIYEQLQSGLLPQSVTQSGAACRSKTRGRHPDTGRVTSRAVHHQPASRRRLSWRRSAGRTGNA